MGVLSCIFVFEICFQALMFLIVIEIRNTSFVSACCSGVDRCTTGNVEFCHPICRAGHKQADGAVACFVCATAPSQQSVSAHIVLLL